MFELARVWMLSTNASFQCSSSFSLMSYSLLINSSFYLILASVSPWLLLFIRLRLSYSIYFQCLSRAPSIALQKLTFCYKIFCSKSIIFRLYMASFCQYNTYSVSTALSCFSSTVLNRCPDTFSICCFSVVSSVNSCCRRKVYFPNPFCYSILTYLNFALSCSSLATSSVWYVSMSCSRLLSFSLFFTISERVIKVKSSCLTFGQSLERRMES